MAGHRDLKYAQSQRDIEKARSDVVDFGDFVLAATPIVGPNLEAPTLNEMFADFELQLQLGCLFINNSQHYRANPSFGGVH